MIKLFGLFLGLPHYIYPYGDVYTVYIYIPYTYCMHLHAVCDACVKTAYLEHVFEPTKEVDHLFK